MSLLRCHTMVSSIIILLKLGKGGYDNITGGSRFGLSRLFYLYVEFPS